MSGSQDKRGRYTHRQTHFKMHNDHRVSFSAFIVQIIYCIGKESVYQVFFLGSIAAHRCLLFVCVSVCVCVHDERRYLLQLRLHSGTLPSTWSKTLWLQRFSWSVSRRAATRWRRLCSGVVRFTSLTAEMSAEEPTSLTLGPAG